MSTFPAPCPLCSANLSPATSAGFHNHPPADCILDGFEVACADVSRWNHRASIPRFPTMLRKMWSGREVQQWLDENVAPPCITQIAPDAAHAPLTKERRLAINGLISHWMSEQDPEGRVLDTLDYFDVDKIDELIDEAIAPAIADAVAVALAALPSDAAQAPIYQAKDRDAAKWLDCSEHAHVHMSKYPDMFDTRIVYAAPVAADAAAPSEETLRTLVLQLADMKPQYEENIVAGMNLLRNAFGAASKAAQPDERAAFEAWAVANGMHVLTRHGSDEYLRDPVNICWLAWQARATAPQATVKGDEPRLDKRAQVGYTRFGVGVKWSTVIGAAQRHHEYMNTPENEAERIRQAQLLADFVQGRAAAQQARATLTHEQVNAIMDQAQVFASAWSLIGGPFDSGLALDTAENEREALRVLLATHPAENAGASDCDEVLADHRRLVRELDVLLNGEAGAAAQASLVDIVAQVRRECIRSVQYPGAIITQAAKDVLAERARQVSVEGWTPEHDDEHDSEEMAIAAACYAESAGGFHHPSTVPSTWPWTSKWWKPTTPRRDLVKAGALILAEIERIDRAGGEA